MNIKIVSKVCSIVSRQQITGRRAGPPTAAKRSNQGIETGHEDRLSGGRGRRDAAGRRTGGAQMASVPLMLSLLIFAWQEQDDDGEDGRGAKLKKLNSLKKCKCLMVS